ncbi:hypothetical protein KFL_001190100 [Klebsormidium nitens]|uniref:Tryptophan synthase beta chain-like PALP domain-containing protein n=1 Tax=Klebsormidium nitens TaxID=105231 RepID=A0A0U9HUU3_KLENI|nr:hypothetical protein KFL_001190100 [Klebsormidium nitens]|eukprot:GAQ82667.1 hypothetical protein KFL_001190100 [Klebsormidium nitens]
MLSSISFDGLSAPLGQFGGIAHLQCTRSRISPSPGLNAAISSQSTCPVRIPSQSSESPYYVDEQLVKSILARNWFLKHPHSRVDKVKIQEASDESKVSETNNGGVPEGPPSTPALSQLKYSPTQSCIADIEPLHKYSVSKGRRNPFESEEDACADDQDSQIGLFSGSERGKVAPNFFVVRDDLLHPLMGGNKMRKLDALVPQLQGEGVTDVITCGGMQSAHTAAVAVACAESQMTAHLLLRGERPQILTGYTLVCHMYGHVTYVPRSEYADRDAMFAKHVDRLSKRGPGKVGVIKEGAGDAFALLGLIRLVDHLRSLPEFRGADPLDIVVDSGTGTTAVGMALGAALLGLPWTVSGIMLASGTDYYTCQQEHLLHEFWAGHVGTKTAPPRLQLEWIERETPRKFGKVFSEEFATCQGIARQTGILMDPIYTLAGWEVAERKAVQALEESRESKARESRKVVYLHTGGTLGLFGLAQRYPSAI